MAASGPAPAVGGKPPARIGAAEPAASASSPPPPSAQSANESLGAMPRRSGGCISSSMAGGRMEGEGPSIGSVSTTSGGRSRPAGVTVGKIQFQVQLYETCIR